MKTDKLCSGCIYFDNRYKTCRSPEEIANYGECISILSDKISDQSIELTENKKKAKKNIQKLKKRIEEKDDEIRYLQDSLDFDREHYYYNEWDDDDWNNI